MTQTCSNPEKWIFPNSAKPAVVLENFSEIGSAVSNAIAQGVICIAAAGNSSENRGKLPSECDPSTIPFPSYPAQYPNVIAVSGTRLVNGVEEFRDGWNYGSFITASAPGVDIWTSDSLGGYIKENGTSFSSPLVSALAGLIKSINPRFSIQQVTDIITSTADKIDASNFDASPKWLEPLFRLRSHQRLRRTTGSRQEIPRLRRHLC